MGDDARIARPGQSTRRAGEARDSTNEARASSLISRASIQASTTTAIIFNEYSLFVSFAVIRAICLYVRNNIFKGGDQDGYL